jgi:hypothetical protein
MLSILYKCKNQITQKKAINQKMVELASLVACIPVTHLPNREITLLLSQWLNKRYTITNTARL